MSVNRHKAPWTEPKVKYVIECHRRRRHRRQQQQQQCDAVILALSVNACDDACGLSRCPPLTDTATSHVTRCVVA